MSLVAILRRWAKRTFVRTWEKIQPRTAQKWQIRELRREFAPRLEAARAQGDRERARAINQEWDFRYRELDEDFRVRLTNTWLAKARRLDIAVPPRPVPRADTAWQDQNWQMSQVGEWFLEPKAFNKLRSKVRRERRERHEWWLPLVTSVTGLLGVLLALLSTCWKNG